MAFLDYISDIAGLASPFVSFVNPVAGTAVNMVGRIAQRESAKNSAQSALNDERNWNAQQADINRQFQRGERLEAQAWNEKMWQKEMDYNSPANQLRLAMEAGINPNSVFGNSNPFVQTSAPTTSGQSGNVTSSAGSIASHLLLQDAQLANLVASTRKTEADAESQEISNEYAPRLNDVAIREAEERIKKTSSERGLTDAQTNQIIDMLPLLKDKTAAEIDELYKKSSKLVQDTALALQQTNKAEAEAIIDKFKANFCALYGVTPDSNPIQMLAQLLVSGEKGRDTVNAIMTTLTEITKGLIMDSYDRSPALMEEGFQEGYKRGQALGHRIKKAFKSTFK